MYFLWRTRGARGPGFWAECQEPVLGSVEEQIQTGILYRRLSREELIDATRGLTSATIEELELRFGPYGQSGAGDRLTVRAGLWRVAENLARMAADKT